MVGVISQRVPNLIERCVQIVDAAVVLFGRFLQNTALKLQQNSGISLAVWDDFAKCLIKLL